MTPASLPAAFVSVGTGLGGSERVLLELAARLPAHGVTPTVVLPKSGPLGEALLAAGVPVVVAPAPERLLALSQRTQALGGDAVGLIRGLAAWARAIRAALPPDIRVLHSNGFKAHLACALVRGDGMRRVWHLHEFPPPRVGPLWRLLAAALPHVTVANSRAVAAAWRIPGATPEVILNGVDLERFRPAPRTGWIHQSLALPGDARLIGMPAVFARWKGQIPVVEAFERAAARVPDAHLVIAGGPIYDTVAERGYAEELVRRVGRASLPGVAPAAGGGAPARLGDRIHFLKFQAEPWRLYPECDLVVHYSTRPEPFGRVIVESLACGVPVVAARAGGPLEIVEHGTSGWLVAPNDPAALAEALVGAMAADLAPLRRAARARAQAAFSADRQAAEVAALLHRIAG